MKIGLACDHAGFEYKEQLKEYLSRISPDQEKIVKLHKKNTPIFQVSFFMSQNTSTFARFSFVVVV